MNRLLAAALGVVFFGACNPQPQAARPRAEQEPQRTTAAAPAAAPAAATAPLDPRDIQIAEVGMVPGGLPQGPEQGELYTTREQTQGVPVLVMPVAPDRLDSLLGTEPDEVQMLIIPLVDERTPVAAQAESAAEATSETVLPSPANVIEAYGDPFQPPPRVLQALPTKRP